MDWSENVHLFSSEVSTNLPFMRKPSIESSTIQKIELMSVKKKCPLFWEAHAKGEIRAVIALLRQHGLKATKLKLLLHHQQFTAAQHQLVQHIQHRYRLFWRALQSGQLNMAIGMHYTLNRKRGKLGDENKNPSSFSDYFQSSKPF